MININLSDKDKKEMCQCRKCGRVFNQNEVKHVHKKQLGQNITYGVCPECGSIEWGLINYPIQEEDLIYKTGKFYLYNGRHIRNNLHKLGVY